MSDRTFRFVPEFNWGHVGVIVSVIFSAGMYWQANKAALDAVNQRVDQLVRDVDRTSKEGVSAETRLVARINEQKAQSDQDRAQLAYEMRELKQFIKDEFKDFRMALDRKADKPGR